MSPEEEHDPGPALQAALQRHQQGQLQVAAALYRKILQAHPRHAETLNLLGTLSAQQGSLDEARSLIEQALRQAPGNSAYHANLGQVLVMSGDDAGAVRRYRQALGQDSGNVAALLGLGNLHLRGDRIEEAAESFSAALGIDPNLAVAHEGMGCVRQRLNQVGEAIGCFERALAFDPGSAAAHANLASLLLEQKQTQAAITHLQAALRLAPDRLDLHTNLGFALHLEGRFRNAVMAYDHVLTRLRYSARALGAKGLALRELGHHAEAAEIFDHERLIQLTPPPAVIGSIELATFNQQLVAFIADHPTLIADRAGKSTRGGSQTGELFDGMPGPLAALATYAQEAVKRYFEDEERAAHAYCPPCPARNHLTGWATVLRSGGHQEPHNHPNGIVSGVYYPRLPAGADQGAPDDGAIEFGRASDRFCARADPNLRLVQPQEGMMLIFPSHLWHRTLPFRAAEARVSIAFDLVAGN